MPRAGGDLFVAINTGRASIVTERIETLTEKGILLRSGVELAADLIVTATGLELLFLGDVELEVDGQRVDPAKAMTYKAMMLSDVPNLAISFGYTNASWTLKSDLTGEYVCRLLNLMKQKGFEKCVPRRNDPTMSEEPFLDFSSGYIRRGLDRLPKQGSKAPWKLHQNYAMDILSLRYGNVEDGVLELS